MEKEKNKLQSTFKSQDQSNLKCLQEEEGDNRLTP